MTAVLTAVPTIVSAPSFEDFYRDNRPTIARTLAASLGDEELGFEAADEAMSRAFQSWGDVSSYTNPQGWVFRTGRNWGISKLRRRTAGKVKTRLVDWSLSRDDQRTDPDICQAIDHLSADHRIVVVLRFYADWTIDQIAVELGVPAGTVKSRLSRALATLQSNSVLAA